MPSTLKDDAKSGFSDRPLADRMRPVKLNELVGQPEVTDPGGLIGKALAEDRIFSMIMWGPPGCGKTAFANISAHSTGNCFIRTSAVLSNVGEIRDIIRRAKALKEKNGRGTILFVDEIHRFTKAQQDAFLHHVENGLITLMGATTQNPSFAVIPALVSRCRVVPFNGLDHRSLAVILERALADREKGLGMTAESKFTREALEYIAAASGGDARTALTVLENAAFLLEDQDMAGIDDVREVFHRKILFYDKTGDEHFNQISAFIKSMRGSDPDAAMYWMARMLSAGDDPLYLLRRMVRFATEDIGNADPGALTMALNALEAFRFLGHPEGDDVLFQAAVYLATAPKSNRVYLAGKAVGSIIEKDGYCPVPKDLCNAPTKLMKDLGYSDGYRYPHDEEDAYTPRSYLPGHLSRMRFYRPTGRGYEKIIKTRLEGWLDKRNSKKQQPAEE